MLEGATHDPLGQRRVVVQPWLLAEREFRAGDGAVAEYSGRTLRVLHGHWQEFIDIDLEGPSITIRIDDCTSATVNLPLSSSASRF